jgi:hypothetical protein
MSLPVPNKPKPPNAGSSCDNTTIECKLHCPKVEIQINRTSTTTDDLVPIKCLIPAGAATTPCRIRAVGGPAPSNTVVLTNPDHRLRFPGDADTLLTIDLPTDGSWADFEISGASGSAALKDAIIEVHCATAAGALLAKTAATVFWFDDAHIDVKVGGKYEVFADMMFRVMGQPAVHLRASARIRPAGVDCTAPQIRDLRVGIVQNSFPPNGSEPRSRKVLYGPPVMEWLPETQARTRVKLPAQWHRTQEIKQITNDSTEAAAPFYALPPAVKGSTKPALPKPPVGCKGGGSTESQDDPGTPLHGSLKVRVTDGSGHAAETEPVTTDAGKKLEVAPVIGGKGKTLGTAIYPYQRVFHKEKFITWAVIFNVTTKAFCCLRQRAWTLDLDSADPSHAEAVPDSADAEPTVVPVTDPPFSNDLNEDPRYWTTGPIPGPTIEDKFDPKPSIP